MKVGGVLVGMTFWVAAGGARADNPQGGLAGLDVVMNGTGRIGALAPRSDAPIGAPRIPDEQRLRSAPPAARADDGGEHTLAPRPVGISEEELLQTERPVASCRIEVARRRRVAPARVPAGTVALRFTIEPSGRVRDAEAIWAQNTDLDVAACAKRVLSEWTFAKHATGDIHAEHVYRLTDVRLTSRAGSSLAAVSH